MGASWFCHAIVIGNGINPVNFEPLIPALDCRKVKLARLKARLY
jgi:hypothetical protein